MITMSTKPIIGIVLDASIVHEGYSTLPWYALRRDYFTAVRRQGGIPIALPYEIDCIGDYLDHIDGLLLPGGDCDIPPSAYGETTIHPSVVLSPERWEFEAKIARRAIDQNIPLLGICAGLQVINVVMGGTLIQHIPDAVPDALNHQQPDPRSAPWHEVIITEGSLLHEVTQSTQLMVNSSHHQAVKNVGEGLVINAIASDGVIEGVEHQNHPFCLGVEWHPEHEAIAEDRAIIRALIDASKMKYSD